MCGFALRAGTRARLARNTQHKTIVNKTRAQTYTATKSKKRTGKPSALTWTKSPASRALEQKRKEEGKTEKGREKRSK